jgi:hypothetical protein
VAHEFTGIESSFFSGAISTLDAHGMFQARIFCEGNFYDMTFNQVSSCEFFTNRKGVVAGAKEENHKQQIKK